jgi:mono/diheme cytochrome c family protein
MARIAAAGLLIASAAFAAPNAPAPVTFNKDVLPLLQKQCQECHRPGEVAPMSFITYKETRPWAKAIKAAVLTRKMPPWFADPGYGHFANERRLSQAEIDKIAAWVDNGSPEGDAKDKPAPVSFASGWSIGKPDIVVEFPHPVSLPASGLVDQTNLLVKVNFPHDIWVKAAEVRPGNPKVVHHMKAWIRPPGSPWMKDAPEGEIYLPTRGQFSEATTTLATSTEGPRPVLDILAKYNPGVNAQEFTLGGAAKFIAAGSDIVFELHYVTTGKPETDRSRVGMVLASAPPEKRYLTITGVNNNTFVIPAHAGHYEVKAQATVQAETWLAWVQPHMHLRAKDYELRALYPSGESEILLKGPFDFNWQLGYEFAKPVMLPKGTRLETTKITRTIRTRTSLCHMVRRPRTKWPSVSWALLST